MIKKSLLCVFFLALLVAPLTAIAEPEHVAKLRAEAEKGDADAQVALGILYEDGEGVPQNYKEAVRLYTQAANKGHIDGIFFLGRLLYAAQDYKAAAKVLRRGAEAGDSHSQAALGILYREGLGVSQDFNEAAKWNKKAAVQGRIFAQRSLGFIYNAGQGVPQSYEESVKWYREAAEQGDTYSQWRLGLAYEAGEGVPKNGKEAVKWYRKAAEQGDATAQLLLGGTYYAGIGVSTDDILSYKWVVLASAGEEKNIEEEAIKFLLNLVKGMTPEQVAEGERLSREWREAFEARKKN